MPCLPGLLPSNQPRESATHTCFVVASSKCLRYLYSTSFCLRRALQIKCLKATLFNVNTDRGELFTACTDSWLYTLTRYRAITMAGPGLLVSIVSVATVGCAVSFHEICLITASSTAPDLVTQRAVRWASCRKSEWTRKKQCTEAYLILTYLIQKLLNSLCVWLNV